MKKVNPGLIAGLIMIIAGLFLVISIIAIVMIATSPLADILKRPMLLFMVAQTLFNVFIEFCAYRLLVLVGDAKTLINSHINWHKELDRRAGITRRPIE